MDEQTRQQVTWIVIVALVISLVVLVAYRRAEVDMKLDTIANGPPAERVAAVEVLVEDQKLQEALEDEPRWVQDRAVEAAMMLATQRAMQQLVAAKTVVDAPVAERIDMYLTQTEVSVGPLVLSLRDKDGAVRGAASGPLKTIGAAAVSSLMPLIDVYDDAVRGLVSSTLGGIGEPAVKPLLGVMKQEKPKADQGPAAFRRAKSAAAAAFKAMGETALEPMIDDLLKYDDAEVRLAATGILGSVAAGLEDKEVAGQAVEPLVARLMTDEAWAVRRKAATALGGLGDVALNNGVLEPLIGELSHPRSEVRAAVAAALGNLGNPAAAEPLAKLLLTNRVGATAEIAQALEKIGHASIEPLGPALEAGDEDLRLTATQTIATIGTSDAVEPLGRALDDPEVKVRRAAAEALRNLADERVLEELAAALGDSESKVYYAARDALARMGRVAVPALVERLGSGDTRVAFTAQQALSRIGGPAVGPLVNALRSDDAQIAHWSGIALGRIGEEAVEPAAEVLGHTGAPARARVEAARALGVTGSFSATEPLEEAAHAAPAAVREAAIHAMGEIGDERATDTLVAGLEDDTASVRERAMEVLIDWRVGEVDRKLKEVIGEDDADAARRAAVVLAQHTPEASGELIRAIGGETGEAPGEAPEVRELLEATVADRSAPDALRHRAIDALRVVGTNASLEALAPLVKAGGEFATSAVKAVGKIGERSVEEKLAEIEGPVTEIEVSRAAETLLSMFDSAEDRQLRLIAASGLAVMGRQPVQPLIDRLKTASDTRKAWIIATLGAIGKPATNTVLDARGRETDTELSNWLAAALVLIGDARAMDLIRQLPDEEQPDPEKVRAGRHVYSDLQQLL